MQNFTKTIQILVAVLLTGISALYAPHATAQVVINEITTDAGNNDGVPASRQTGEFIELYNAGAAAVNIGGWIIADSDAAWRFPTGASIAPGQHILISSHGLNAATGGASATGISCTTCDFNGITVDYNWGSNAPNMQPATNGGSTVIGSTCVPSTTPANQPNCDGAGNLDEGWMLFDNMGATIDAVYWGKQLNLCTIVPKTFNFAVNAGFGAATTISTSVPPFDGTNTAVWEYVGNRIQGCNSSYQRMPDGGTWANGDLNFAALALPNLGTYTAGAQPTTQPTNHPTPRNSNASVPFTFALTATAGALGAPVISGNTASYNVCGAGTLELKYVINNHQNVSPNPTDVPGIGSYVRAVGAGAFAPAAWTITGAGTGTTTLTYTITPPVGTTTYDAVWKDFIVDCCGSGSLNVPVATTGSGVGGTNSCAWECYEGRKIVINRLEPMVATKTAISCPADFTAGTVNIGSLITGGIDRTYTLNPGAQTNTTGVFNLPTAQASPMVVTVTDGSGCTPPITITINDNCKKAPVCPTLVLKTTTTTASGNKCPGDVIKLCVDSLTSTNLPNGGTVEWYKGTTAAFDPYTSAVGDRLCESPITIATPICPPAINPLIINEVAVAPTTGDAGAGGEFVEIFNPSSCPIDISCYVVVHTFTNSGSNPAGYTVRIPANTTIAPCSYYTISGAGSAGGAALVTGTNWSTSASGAQNTNASADLNLGIAVNRGLATFLAGTRPGNNNNPNGQISLLNSSLAVVNSVSWGVAASANPSGAFPIGIAAPTPGCSGTTIASTVIPNATLSVATVTPAFGGGATANHSLNRNSDGTLSASLSTTFDAANTSQTVCAIPPVTVPCCAYNITTADCNNGGNLFFKAIVKPIDASCAKPAATTAAAGAFTVTCPTAVLSGAATICNGTPAGTANLTLTSATSLAGYTLTYLRNGTSTTSPALAGTSPYSIAVSAAGTYETVSLNAPAGSCAGTVTGNAEVKQNNPPLNSVQGGCNAAGEPTIQVFNAEGVAASYTLVSVTPTAAGLPITKPSGVFVVPAGTTGAVVEMTIGGCTTQVSVVVTACNTLPILSVNFANFTAKAENNSKVILNWATATETNNNRFEIERSSNNGASFEKIGTQKGNGTTMTANAYNFIDNAPKVGMNLYRLRQIDNDGTATVSNIVMAKIAGEFSFGTTYPVPFNDVLNIDVVSARENTAQIILTDMMGKVVLTQQIMLNNGTNNLSLNTSALAKGVYNVIIQNEKQSIATKVVK